MRTLLIQHKMSTHDAIDVASIARQVRVYRSPVASRAIPFRTQREPYVMTFE